MEHVLDNPAWNALNSGNQHLANGNHAVKYFDKEVSPFAGASQYTPENLEQLYQLLPDNSPRLLIAPSEISFPSSWKVLGTLQGFQMVNEASSTHQPDSTGLVALTDEHIPQMLALTQLTNPGPFASRTIQFGHYYGIFQDDELVAMAGQRMHVANYTEISAVCTHPNHLGKGYARQLLQYHTHRMQAAGNIPFLHVRYDNHRAIKVYEDMGFAVRIPICFHFVQKEA